MAAKSKDKGLQNLKAQLKSGDLKRLYLFYGEEEFLKHYYFQLLKQAIVDDALADFNYQVFEGSRLNYDEIESALITPPMMSQRKLLLMKDTNVFKSASEEAKKFWHNRFGQIPDYVCLVFYEQEIDRRSALYKSLTKYGEGVECTYMEAVELRNWIGRGCRESGKRIGQRDADYLIQLCDASMNHIKRELEKLFAYCSDTITRADIDRIVTKMPQSRVFELMNEMMRKNGQGVFSRLEEMKTLKESPFLILSLLCTNFERILHTKILVEKGTPYQNIAGLIGISPYFVRDYVYAAGQFEKVFLHWAISRCAEIDFGIKEGKLSDWLAIEQFLAQCMQ